LNAFAAAHTHFEDDTDHGEIDGEDEAEQVAQGGKSDYMHGIEDFAFGDVDLKI